MRPAPLFVAVPLLLSALALVSLRAALEAPVESEPVAVIDDTPTLNLR